MKINVKWIAFGKETKNDRIRIIKNTFSAFGLMISTSLLLQNDIVLGMTLFFVSAFALITLDIKVEEEGKHE